MLYPLLSCNGCLGPRASLTLAPSWSHRGCGEFRLELKPGVGSSTWWKTLALPALGGSVARLPWLHLPPRSLITAHCSLPLPRSGSNRCLFLLLCWSKEGNYVETEGTAVSTHGQVHPGWKTFKMVSPGDRVVRERRTNCWLENAALVLIT